MIISITKADKFHYRAETDYNGITVSVLGKDEVECYHNMNVLLDKLVGKSQYFAERIGSVDITTKSKGSNIGVAMMQQAKVNNELLRQSELKIDEFKKAELNRKEVIKDVIIVNVVYALIACTIGYCLLHGFGVL